jgi:hypothetical protein
MVARLVWILLCLTPFVSPLQAVAPKVVKAQPMDNTFIKLLVVHDKPGVVLEVKGQYKVYDPNTDKFISTRFKGKRKYMQAISDGIKWGEEFPGIHQLMIVPNTLSTTTIVDGIEYKGRIYVYDIGGAISIVNELTLDDYVRCTIAQQYETSNLSDEAMNAVVIAARTNAYYLVQNPGSKFWTIDARKTGYQGHTLVNVNPKFEKALERTHNMVLSDDNNEVKAFANNWGISAGQSEAIKNIISSSISVVEADDLAKKGNDAAKILSKAYPQKNLKVLK